MWSLTVLWLLASWRGPELRGQVLLGGRESRLRGLTLGVAQGNRHETGAFRTFLGGIGGWLIGLGLVLALLRVGVITPTYRWGNQGSNQWTLQRPPWLGVEVIAWAISFPPLLSRVGMVIF